MREERLLNNAIDIDILNKQFNNIIYDDTEEKTDDPYRWTGIVIDNNDPRQLGRVRIRISGKYDELEDNVLPWAVPDISFIGGQKGNFVVPVNGTIVRGYFDQGDVEKPIFDSIAFSNIRKDKTSLDKIGEDINTDYPHKMILFETDDHDVLTLNRLTGVTEFKHRSGLIIQITSNGAINIHTGNQNTENAGDISVNCYSNTNINTFNTTNITSQQGDINVSAPLGNINLGENEAKQLANNLPTCMLTGIPHCINNINVKL